MVSLAAPDERLREGDHVAHFNAIVGPSANEFRDPSPVAGCDRRR